MLEASKPLVIINADDYGRSLNINRAIIDAIKQRLVTDTSMMATIDEGFQDACKKEYKDCIDSKLGIHFSLTLGNPLTDTMRMDKALCDDNGEFLKVFGNSIDWSKERKRVLYGELCAQVEKIREAGFTITHADSHQHVHLTHAILPVFIKCCKDMKIPVLRLKVSYHDRLKQRIGHLFEKYLYKFYGLKSIDNFSAPDIFTQADYCEGDYITEIMTHPIYNSRNEIANKVSRASTDDCGILREQLKDVIPLFRKVNFEEAFNLY